jgi:hypothetical protein
MINNKILILILYVLIYIMAICLTKISFYDIINRSTKKSKREEK